MSGFDFDFDIVGDIRHKAIVEGDGSGVVVIGVCDELEMGAGGSGSDFDAVEGTILVDVFFGIDGEGLAIKVGEEEVLDGDGAVGIDAGGGGGDEVERGIAEEDVASGVDVKDLAIDVEDAVLSHVEVTAVDVHGELGSFGEEGSSGAYSEGTVGGGEGCGAASCAEEWGIDLDGFGVGDEAIDVVVEY